MNSRGRIGKLINKSKFRRTLAISTVIATIIIVSISIVMAIAVAYWAMGIGNSFTKFEKIEFTNIYSDVSTNLTYRINNIDYNNNVYRLVLTLKNTGTATATIDTINLNGRPYTAYNSAGAGIQYPIYQNLNGLTITPGQIIGANGNYVIYLPTATGAWRSGDYVQIDIGTTAGRDYQNTVNLP
jgi:archaeal type IV pilus assembly protein PilA